MNIAQDGVGLVVLAGEFAIAMLLFDHQLMSFTAWIGLYCIIAIIAIAIWHSEKAPQSSLLWLEMVVGSFVLGLLFFVSDILVGHISHPNLPLIEAAQQAPFGFFLTLATCPGLTIIAIAGLVRIVFGTKLGGWHTFSRK